MSILKLKKSVENRINLYICSHSDYSILYNPLIKLDKEDIEYFKKKYYPKLNDELVKELEKVIKKYN